MTTNANSLNESRLIDEKEENLAGLVKIDTDGDGIIDTIALDTDGNGVMDALVFDFDEDGVIDAVAVDVNEDGHIDSVGVDLDGDGVMDVSVNLDDAGGNDVAQGHSNLGNHTKSGVIEANGGENTLADGADFDLSESMNALLEQSGLNALVDAIGINSDDEIIDTVLSSLGSDDPSDAIGSNLTDGGLVDLATTDLDTGDLFATLTEEVDLDVGGLFDTLTGAIDLDMGGLLDT